MTWERPAELEAEGEAQSGEWVWLKHPTKAYVPAQVIKRESINAICKALDGEAMTVLQKDVGPAIPRLSALKRPVNDLVQMDQVIEPTVMHNLKIRFEQSKIYTSIGNILVSVNPFKMLPLYTPAVMDMYAKKGSRQLAPHVYSIASDAYNKLSQERINVSVLISGESGAGKTECTKQVLQYLSEVAGSTTGVERKVLSANPVLEAFGNAKTLRNNNSSRFGKFMEVHFDSCSRISGCSTVNYLLEKSRIVQPGPGERSYHIFYMLCAAAPAEMQETLHLSRPDGFRYLSRSGCVSVPGLDDVKEFHEVEEAFQTLAFGAEEIREMYGLVAAVLHLGNLNFVEKGSGSALDGASACSNALKYAAELLKCPADVLGKAFCVRTIEARGESMKVDLQPAQSQDACDSLSKALYGRLFDWLVKRVNQAMAVDATAGGRDPLIIGILDIFGFEIFEKNSFEQLCINFCNEKLQQHFNTNTFKLEEDTYKAEGVPFTHVEYIDNQDVLDLIEKKKPQGLLVLLDDEINVPRGSDKGYYSKAVKNYKDHGRFSVTRIARTEFIVSHYAGDVQYDTTGFLEKNKDRLTDDLADIMAASGSTFIANTLFAYVEVQKKSGLRGTKAAKGATQGGQFRQQLTSLMTVLNETSPLYIRCIKPNSEKRSDLFDAPMSLQQLRYAGVFEAVSIRKQGYPFRYLHEDFFKRYRIVIPSGAGGGARGALGAPGQGDARARCEKLLKEIGKKYSVVSTCQVGRTMILYRAEQHMPLELARCFVTESSCRQIQKLVRGYTTRINMAEVYKALPLIKAAIESRELAQVQMAVELASGLFIKPPLARHAEVVLEVLEEEKELKGLAAKLAPQEPEANFDAFDALQKKMDVIREKDSYACQDAASLQVTEKWKSVFDRRKCKKDLIDGASELDKKMLDEAMALLQTLKAQWGSFCPDEEARALAAIQRIEQEVRLAATIDEACRPQHGVTGIPGKLEAHTIDTSKLTTALDECKRLGCQTPPAVEAARKGNLVLKLRRSLHSALSSDQKAKDPLWQNVQDELKNAANGGIVGSEMTLLLDDFAMREKVDDICEKLEYACQKIDEEWLVYGLEQARRLDMDAHPNATVRGVTSKAREVLGKVQECKTKIKEGIETLNKDLLDEALGIADTFAYATPLVTQGREVRDRLAQILRDIDRAIKEMNVEEIERVIEECQHMRFKLPQLKKCREILAMPEEKRLQLQLRAAVILGDTVRVTKVTMRIKEIFFDKAGGLFQFEKFPGLKSKNQFAKRFGVAHDRLRDGMLDWSREPIHTSLTRIDDHDPAIRAMGVKLFRSVMGYMGDRHYTYPLMLAQEVLKHGLEVRCGRAACVCVKRVYDIYIYVDSYETSQTSHTNGDTNLAILSFLPSFFSSLFLSHPTLRRSRI